ncbi:MAG: hypothetical protein KF764_12055 [Labilithrix sp.]|nr:hypothetical protein [Labilithrix sp.]
MSDAPKNPPARDANAARLRPEHVRVLRLGHGANCSSVGSVVDTLFLGAVAGGAVFAAICAAMRDEPVRVVGGGDADAPTAPSAKSAAAVDAPTPPSAKNAAAVDADTPTPPSAKSGAAAEAATEPEGPGGDTPAVDGEAP